MKKFFRIILIATMVMVPTLVVLGQEPVTIKVTKDNYTPSKNEPSKGIYTSAYVLQDEFINKDMSKFNELTGKKHSSFFKYVGYGKPFPTEWVEEVKAVGAVPHIAWEPNNGLDKVVDDDYIRKFAKDAKDSNVPIFLRYASEMNGTWTQYSGKAELYKEKWKLVHEVMKQDAPNVIMVWTVFTFPEETIRNFYPGDEYVDWVGVNIYNVMYHNNKISEKADKEDPLRLLDFVYNEYSHSKPIQISEYGVTNYTITDSKSHVDFAVNKINRIYNNLEERYPRVKSIYYFDVNNLVNASEGRRINNYAITENTKILNAYKKAVSGDNFLSSVVKEGGKGKEVFTYTNYSFQKNSKIYTDVKFYKDYLGLSISNLTSNKVTLSNGKITHTFPIVNSKVDKGFYKTKYNVRGVSIRDVADKFGYKLYFEQDKNIVNLSKK